MSMSINLLPLLSRLKKSDINIELENNQLKINAPKGKLTPDLINELKDKKEGIVKFLQQVQKQLKYAPIEAAEKKEYYVLSSTQRRLYILQQMEPESISYNMPNVLLIEKEIDKERLEGIFEKLISRHDSLRTSFEMIDEEPVQKIHKNVEFHIEYHDISKNEEKEIHPSSKSKQLIIHRFVRPFDLSVAPMLRVGLIKTTGKEHILMLDVHHIITDGISQDILTEEFMWLSTGEELNPLRLQYKDYSEWRNSREVKEAFQQQENYWLTEFEGEIPVLNVPTDYPRPAIQSFEGHKLYFDLGKEEAKALKTKALGEKVTSFMLILTIVYIMLSKISGQKDIIIGTDTAGRNHPDLEPVIGMFVNTLPLRNFPTPQKTFEQFMREVKERTLRAFDNQGYQFEDLVERIDVNRDVSRNPVFDVMFSYEDMEAGTGETPAQGKPKLEIKPYAYENRTAKFDLTLIAREASEQLSFSLEYCTKLFQKETIQRFIAYFKQIVSSVIADVDSNIERKISEIEIIPEEEKKQVLDDFNANTADFPKDKTVCHLIEHHSERIPDRIAIACEGNELTYGELNERSNQLARLLRERGISRDQLVGVLCERSVEMAIGILSVWKAGGGYIPIDINYPFDRINTILADSGVEVLLTKSNVFPNVNPFYMEIVPHTHVKHIIYLDEENNIQHHNRLFKTLRYSSLLSLGIEPPLDRESVLQYDNQTLTYQEYMNKVKQTVKFISNRKIELDSPVAVVFTNPIYKIIALLYLNLCSVPFIVLDPELGRNEKKRIINESRISTIFSESRFFDQLDQLLWESPTLKNCLILDDYRVGTNEKESHFKEIWDYVAEESSEAINDYGWTNSYTNEPFTIEEMNEYIQNFKVKLEPHLNPHSRVLDIGCGHGLVLFEIAPHVGYYLATDLSPVIIEKNKLRIQKEGLHHVELKAAAASEINKLEEKDFDIVICSSVVHYFPNTLFLEEVIKSAIRLLKDEGIIYLDDLMDLRKKEELIRSTLEYRTLNPESLVKTDWDGDLFVDVDFFHDLQLKYPEIVEWESSRKLGSIKNELTRFRYDVLLKVNKNKNKNKKTKTEPAFPLKKNRYIRRDIETNAAPPIAGLDDCRMNRNIEFTHQQKQGEKNLRESTIAGDVTDIGTTNTYSKENLRMKRDPFKDLSHLSYVIYTSGSTGKPKGAMVEHIGMMNHIQAKINDLQLTGESIVAQNASHTFDISIWQFFTVLTLGGRTIVYPEDLILDPEEFIKRIIEDGVTILEVVPSYLSVMLDYIGEGSVVPLPLHYLLVTGEEIKPSFVGRWFDKYPEIRMVNAYGPTEASDDITHHMIDKAPREEGIRIPIGKSLQNLNIYIVDKNMKLCPIGIVGEICVSGIGVGKGYLNSPERTSEAFMEDSFVSSMPTHPTHSRTYSTIYKTGDLGRWLQDGTVEFIGRKDYQVKIRGFRIELGEIETKLTRYPEIKEAVVIASEDNRNKYLCAYIVAHDLIEPSTIKEYLMESLPEYMIPAYFIKLERLPLTPNGKINRKALPKPEANADESYIPPKNQLQKKLVEIWSEILGVGKNVISMDSNFFELGGHSLNATVMAARVHKELDVKLSIAEIFKTPTILGLSQYIKEATKDRYASIEPVEKKEYYPLSSAQKRLYALHQMDEISIRFNISIALRLEGTVDKNRVEDTFKKLIQRHESVRTSFELKENEPVQKIHPAVEFELEYFNLAENKALNAEGRGKNEKEIMDIFFRSFDLTKPPLLRVGLIKLPGESYILMTDVHHIISDGTSVDILTLEFNALYAGTELPQLKLQYKDFSGWQNHLYRSGVIKKQEEYWLEQFDGDLPVLNIPLDYPRPKVYKAEGISLFFEIDGDMTAGIKRLVLETETTLFIVLLAAYNVLLSKYSRQEDIVVGTPVAGRRHTDLENLIGLFINMLAIRNRPKGEITFREFLEKVKRNALDAYENQEYQFEELVWSLHLKVEGGRNPVFDAVFVMQNTAATDIPANRSEIPGEFKAIPYDFEVGKVHHELLVNAREGPGRLIFSLEYSTELYKESTARKMTEHYVEILEQVLESNGNIPLKDIEISHDLIAAKTDIILEEQGDFKI